MRDIRFRVWDAHLKAFHYWGFLRTHDMLYFSGLPASNRSNFSFDEVLKLSEQFTGLHDMNGNEIYEGDILFFKWTTPPPPCIVLDQNFLVVFSNKGSDCDTDQCAAFLQQPLPIDSDSLPSNCREWSRMVVVGNKHESPELLTKSVEREKDEI